MESQAVDLNRQPWAAGGWGRDRACSIWETT